MKPPIVSNPLDQELDHATTTPVVRMSRTRRMGFMAGRAQVPDAVTFDQIGAHEIPQMFETPLT